MSPTVLNSYDDRCSDHDWGFRLHHVTWRHHLRTCKCWLNRGGLFPATSLRHRVVRHHIVCGWPQRAPISAEESGGEFLRSKIIEETTYLTLVTYVYISTTQICEHSSIGQTTGRNLFNSRCARTIRIHVHPCPPWAIIKSTLWERSWV